MIPVLKGTHAEKLWLLSRTMLGMLSKPGLQMALLLLNNGPCLECMIFTQLSAIYRVLSHPWILKSSLQGVRGGGCCCP